MSSPANVNSSLRPAWKGGGRGFQPPPTVASERGSGLTRTQSAGVPEQQKPQTTTLANFNKFAALDDDDDNNVAVALQADTAVRLAGSNSNNNSRSEALRSTGTHNRTNSARGRSLADLAARAPPQRERSQSHGSIGEKSSSSGGAGVAGGAATAATTATTRFSSYVAKDAVEANVIRFTRERLLSMRPQPAAAPSDELKEAIEGSIILSETPQDPVCWDTFDGEAIWATVARERRASVKSGLPESLMDSTGLATVAVAGGVGVARRLSGRRELGSSSSGRWQRGVALPPPDQAKKTRDKDAENPSDLWDDPAATEAAADFSGFGGMPEDDDDDDADHHHHGRHDEPFDFEKMAEATRKFDEDLHGSTRSRTSSEAANSEDEGEALLPSVKVDPKRPLATIGTTIQSGSGDHVNVFEDFDDPAVASDEAQEEPKAAIRAADEDASASSRLMAMIGVKKEPVTAAVAAPSSSEPVATTTSAWGAPDPVAKPVVTAAEAAVPLNPWGGPLLPGQGEPKSGGYNLQAQMRAAELVRKAENLRRQQQEEEELQRRAQQQAEEQSRIASAAAANIQQQQQQEGVQSQVELVLMERISAILENTWGQSDLASILSTLHVEDSRVIPLLSNTDALRALILRNPRRIALRPNPVFGTEMATLLMTNAQWQQEKVAQQLQAEAQARSQHQQEMQRRELQQRQMAQEQQRAAAAREVSVVAGAPWYYSDPQGNVQGPFRGDEMRQWLEAGYFKSDLPISQQQNGPFHPLSTLFPDLSVAFIGADAAAAEEAAMEQARAEAERAEAEAAAERERMAKEAAERLHRAREAAERERAERERAEMARLAQEGAALKANEAVNESSSQLKMMLGLGAGGEAHPVEKQTPKTAEKRSSKTSNKSSQQSKAKEPSPPASESSPTQQPKPTAAPTSVWGGASQPVTRKSMSEIQKEEARAAAIQAINREGSRSSGSSGWANVAASRGGSSTWVGGTAMQRPVAVVKATAAGQPHVGQPNVAGASPTGPQGMASQAQRTQSSSASVAEEFGAKMSPALEKWCKDQMMKLNGTDDLTLVSFCMSLNDPVEIRQYLTTYLGSTPQINNFATEFINMKGGAKVQEEWETTANVKKSRKKKGGSR